MSGSTPGQISLESLRSLVELGEVDTVQLALADMQGRLQGKRLDAIHFLEDVATLGTEACSYLLATDVEMATAGGFALTSWDRGYGDFVLRPDLSTLRLVPWHDRTVLLFADVEQVDGFRLDVSPRQILREQVARLARRGWTGLSGTGVVEVHGLHRHRDESAWRTGYRALTPANLYNVDYSLQGTGRIERLLGRIRRSMRAAGMSVESVKGECNFGQHEIALATGGAPTRPDDTSPVQARGKGDRRPGGVQPYLHGEVRRA